MNDLNILLIVCDTLKADHLGCYDYFRNTSPNIDRLAREGVLFEDFYNAGSPTGPGFTCFLTGLYAINHKYYRFGEPNVREVDSTIFTMAQILRVCGYTTAAIDNLINFTPHSKHWVRGYDFYINPAPQEFGLASIVLQAKQVNKRLNSWLRNYSDEPFFLFAHYWDPHTPYDQPEEYRNVFKRETGSLTGLEIKEAPAGYKYVPGCGTAEMIVKEEAKWRSRMIAGMPVSIELYDGEIVYMDKAIGEVIEILEAKEILDETLVIVTSDHGEQLGEHNIWGHDALHDAETHIPLIMRYPEKLQKGSRVKGFCQQIDLLPTLLDLMGKKSDALDIDGKSVMPLLNGGRIRDHIFMENSSGQRSIRTEQWHLLDDEALDKAWRMWRELELYDVKRDPMEVINLAKTDVEKADELRGILRRWIRTNLREDETDPAFYPDAIEFHKTTTEYRQRINSLIESLKGN